MTTPPLPATPCLRVKLDYTQADSDLAGSRFFLSYAGAAPTAGNCITIAGDIAGFWETRLAPYIDQVYSLTEIDVLDIASDSGASGQWTGSHSGGMTSNSVPSNVAVNIEYGIARRYRGGKPRMFMPPPDYTALSSPGQWSTSYAGDVQTAIADFFSDIAGLSVGAVGVLAHVNLSYYKGFTNITNSSGRERAVPTYRDTALVDTVNSYSCKREVGSQRRRRTATTA